MNITNCSNPLLAGSMLTDWRVAQRHKDIERETKCMGSWVPLVVFTLPQIETAFLGLFNCRVIFLGGTCEVLEDDHPWGYEHWLWIVSICLGCKQQECGHWNKNHIAALPKKYTNIRGYFGIPLYYPIFRWYIQSIQFCVVYIYIRPWINNPLLCTLFDILFSGLPLLRVINHCFSIQAWGFIYNTLLYLDGKVKTSTTT